MPHIAMIGPCMAILRHWFKKFCTWDMSLFVLVIRDEAVKRSISVSEKYCTFSKTLLLRFLPTPIDTMAAR